MILGIVWFLLGLVFFTLIAGVVISVAIFVPLFIYTIPYIWWVGGQHEIGKHLDKKKEGVWKTARHATILYKSWITRTRPSF